jgi:CRISPR system Cascade subunit CasC
MFVELHILQNFAPSNLNRDDSNAPKDCEFGGYRRARISSQCLKRAVRTTFRDLDLLPAEHRSQRTKRVSEALADRLTRAGHDMAAATTVAAAAVTGLGLKFDEKSAPDDRKTQYLLFLAEAELDALAAACDAHWDALAAVVPTESTGSGRAAKRAASAVVPKPVQEALKAVLNGGKAADLALFGRMLADLPDKNVEAASQVAHAISTNRVAMEFDFYTAVDDLKPDDTAGADMLGTIEFNSATFYRYSNVDLRQLAHNLGDDEELARATLAAFIRATIAAIPTGKQNSMAAQNPPSFVLAVVRDGGLWSLANAFLSPVTPASDGDLVGKSQQALDRYWGQLTTMYGDDSIRGVWHIALDDRGLSHLQGTNAGNVRRLVNNVLGIASFANGRVA